MRNKLIAVTSILSVILLLIIVVIKQVPKTIELTTFEKAYNIVKFNDEENIEIPVFISYEDSYLVKKENITSVNINNGEDSVSFKIDKINTTEEDVFLKNKKFYKYTFILIPVIELEDDFQIEMNNSSLEINYVQGISVKVNIGTFSYYYYANDDSTLSLKQLKGLVNSYDDKTLVGVSIGLKNNTDNKVIIKNIIPLDTNIECGYDEIILNKTFEQGTEIDDLLGYKFDLYKLSNKKNLDLEIENEISIFLPLKYKKEIMLNKLGFLIEYELNDQIKYLCIDDFTFFETSLYSVKKLNSLKFHTYVNY